MRHDYDVLIAGGGMVGSTLAAALGDSPLRVGVIEPQAPAESERLRVSALTLASQTVLENLGAWPAIPAAQRAPVETMQIWEGDSRLQFDSAEIGEPCLAWIVANADLVTALDERLRQSPNIEWLRPASLAGVEFADQQLRVLLADGRRLNTRLLVGADGPGSRVRAAAAIAWTQHDLGQSAIVATVQTERAHGRTAYQHFLPTGPLALLPLADSNRMSIVWSVDSVQAQHYMAMDDAAFNRSLQEAFGPLLGRLALHSARHSIPLALGFARDYRAHRIALIGDAAHTVHPLAGQGVNLGILDAAALAVLLRQAATDRSDVGARSLLRRYERERKGADLGMQWVTGGFRYLFGSKLPGLHGLRTAALRGTERLPMLKNFFMRRASGLSGEIPELARRLER